MSRLRSYRAYDCEEEACAKEREENQPMCKTEVIYDHNYYCRSCGTYWRIDVHFSTPETARFPRCPCCRKRVRTGPAHREGRQIYARKKLLKKLHEGGLEIETVIFRQGGGYRN